MACGKCGIDTNQGAAGAINAPMSTGATVSSRYQGPSSAMQQVRSLTSRKHRRQMFEAAQPCPQCGARVYQSSGETCPLCEDTGAIIWDGQALPPSQLQERVIEQARLGHRSDDGYVWIASYLPGVAQDADVQSMIRAEAAEHPTWALWGYAPDALAQAGMEDVVQSAAQAMPDAARVSLRALRALAQAQGEARR